jgi:hypothetical protein
LVIIFIMETFFNLFGRLVPKTSDSSSSQVQDPSDGLTSEVFENVRDVKCFLEDGKMQVALFGSSSSHPDGWLANLPWNRVFRSYPYEIPLDQSLSLQKAQILAHFVEGLCSAPQTSEHFPPNQYKEVNLNLKDIISSISESEDIPVRQVRKVALAFLEKLGEAVDNGERIAAPGYALIPRTIPAKEADGDKPARPETKVATFKRRPVKQDDQGFKAWTGDD